jgi:1,4-dihydroxy-2-naphthoyl-CoA hydrolase
MSIWFTPYTPEVNTAMRSNNMLEHLDIQITEVGDNYIKGTMPVDNRTKQPAGLLHGGASVVLAESLGSIGANLVVDPTLFSCVGLEINANHVRAVRNGIVTGIAKPIHIGATTQLWSIEIFDERGSLVCVSRITMAVLKRKSKKLEKYL